MGQVRINGENGNKYIDIIKIRPILTDKTEREFTTNMGSQPDSSGFITLKTTMPPKDMWQN